MQFKVPQFLDIEDKIFGPFTFAQFVYLAGGAGLCFVLFKLLGFLLGAIPILIVAGISLALTFYRPNNKPLVNMLESSLKYAMQNKLYIWKRRTVKGKTKDKEQAEVINQSGIRLTGSKLQDLAWSLDVLDLKKKEETQQ
jgi:hypothetical protein